MSKTSDILLVTLNAKYIHCAFGLRYLKANLGALKNKCEIIEFTIKQRPLDMAEAILAKSPIIVGFGVYIWNTIQTQELIRILKQVNPNIRIVVGGPEVGYEWEENPIVQCADHLIIGEAEDAFRELCQSLLAHETMPKVIHAELPNMKTIELPYSLYSSDDIDKRVVYVEASRGCPFKCQFCLSSLDQKVRNVPLETFLKQMKSLLDRGLRQFKFVDRTFNLAPRVSGAILDFFYENWTPNLFLHFEMVPDRFPHALKDRIERFPPGAVQFEVGIQTFDETVAARIDRRQDNAKIESNLKWLNEKTGVHLHTDLIAGLPGEDIHRFALGFDRLLGLGVEEIQVGILKRLPGAPVAKHTEKWEMIYSPSPPYEILSNKDWSFDQMSKMRRFARFWDMIGNSGRYRQSLPIMTEGPSAFWAFWDFSLWLYAEAQATHGIAQRKMLALIFKWVCEKGIKPELIGEALYADHMKITGKDHVPDFLRPFVKRQRRDLEARNKTMPKRQAQHQQHGSDHEKSDQNRRAMA